MLTPAEHIAEYRRTGKFPKLLWCHCLDVLKYCLEGDVNPERTFFKDNIYSQGSYIQRLSESLEGKSMEEEEFFKARENTLCPEKKWRRFDCEFGDLVIERYLDGDERPFDDYRKAYVWKPALTLIFDMSANSCDRAGHEMEERHKFVYQQALQANREGRPCRVVAVTRIAIPEVKSERMAFVLKDYDDPIFPAVWAPFEKNSNTNDFLNVVQDYFIGTRDSGNGSCTSYNVAEDFADGEVILVEPYTYVKYNPSGVHYES